MPAISHKKRAFTTILTVAFAAVLSGTGAAWATVTGAHHEDVARSAASTPSVLAGGEQYREASPTQPLYSFAIHAKGVSNQATGHVFSSFQPGRPHLDFGPVTCLNVSGNGATVTYLVNKRYEVVVVQAATSTAAAGVRFYLGGGITPTSVKGCYTAVFAPAPIYAGAVQVNG